jgi:hypothetical protein
MRPSAAPLVRTYPCRCKQTHEAIAMIAGLPLMLCPNADGDAIRLAFVKGLPTPVLLTGDPEALTGLERLRAEVRELAAEVEALKRKRAKPE